MKKSYGKRMLTGLLTMIMIVQVVFSAFVNDVQTVWAAESNTEKNYYYISDLNYEAGKDMSYAGYGEIKKDQNIDGGTISLLIDGERVYFNKGMGAHAASQLTYDISKYSKDYTRFVAKIGVDASRADNNGEVKFTIFSSKDGKAWTELQKTEAINSGQDAIDVDVNIEGCKYLRLVADSNGTNASDHSVYADARIVKKNYDLSSEIYKNVKKVSEYDAILSKNSVEDNYSKHLDDVLKREFVNRMGYWTIQNSIKYDETGNVKAAIDWILTDKEALKLFIEAGNVGNSSKCLTALSGLYNKNKDILLDSGDGLVYKKMLIALAVAYSADAIVSPLSFNSPAASYDVLERYQIMKEFYDKDQIENKEQFKSYSMELIRYVMNDSIANNEAKWLREYAQHRYPDKLNDRVNPYKYMGYQSPSYTQDFLYAQENYNKYNEKYLLGQYKIPYGLNEDGSKTKRTWMVMETGGICWNISRLGQNLNKVHGIPAVGVYQPGHEAYLTYSQNKDGKGLWNIGNNISGWGSSCTTWYGGNATRLLFNWNNKYFTTKIINGNQRGNNAGYQLLGQAALNDYEKYSKSFYYNLIANSYADVNEKEKIYNEALKAFRLNLDSFDGLLNTYKELRKPSAEWKVLAKKVIDTYTYYPMAMVDLLKVIESNLDENDVVEIDILKTAALNKALQATEENCLQPGATKEIARDLLGTSKVDLASFSFDGENAGKIVLNSKYDDYNFQVQYSLDNGTSWKATQDHVITLSTEELAKISVQNDIQVKISGAAEVFTIDILEGEKIDSAKLTINDEEDIFVATDKKLENLEYSVDGGTSWKDYTSDIHFSGDQIVKVRYKSYERYLHGETKEFTFKKDTSPETNRYISINHIGFVSAGTSQGELEAEHMIDANPFTEWHTKYGQVADDKSYIISLDKVRFLSQIAYDSKASQVNGRMKEAKVYVSLDGKEWILAGEGKDLENNDKRKTITLQESMPAKYVKIEAVHTYGNDEGQDKYVSGINFSYYEDLTKEYKEPYIEYSSIELTN